MNEKIERLLASQWDSRLPKVENKFVKSGSRIPSPEAPEERLEKATGTGTKPVLLRESKLVLNEGLLERLRSPAHLKDFYQAIQESMQSSEKFPPKLVQEGQKGSINPGKYCLFRGAAQHRGSILASHSAAPGSIVGVPKNFYLDVAKLY